MQNRYVFLVHRQNVLIQNVLRDKTSQGHKVPRYEVPETKHHKGQIVPRAYTNYQVFKKTFSVRKLATY